MASGRLRAAFAAALLSCAFAPKRASAEGSRVPVIAVFELSDSTKRPKRLVIGLTDYLRVKLAESGVVKVVDKGEQEASLKRLIASEKKNSYKSCVDDSCQIPLGKELAADRIVRGKLTRFGKSYVVSVELIDLASGASSGAASDKSNGTEEGLMASVERIANTLAQSINQAVASAAPHDPAPAEAEKPAAELAQTKPLPSAPAPQPSSPTTAQTARPQESGPTTSGQWAMIIGGWGVFAAAYFTEIVVQLVSNDFSRVYYSLLPVGGPILVNYVSKSKVNPDGTISDQSTPLNYVDAGVQLLGAGVAVLGHVLSLNNPPAPVGTSAPVNTSVSASGGIDIHFVFAPRVLGVAGSF
jgi:hypothetical protein